MSIELKDWVGRRSSLLTFNFIDEKEQLETLIDLAAKVLGIDEFDENGDWTDEMEELNKSMLGKSFIENIETVCDGPDINSWVPIIDTKEIGLQYRWGALNQWIVTRVDKTKLAELMNESAI